jgi:hypothetical protein
MKNMENTNNSFNTLKITQPKPVGEWKIGEGDYFISFSLIKKPNWFRRVMANLFFGLKWIDFPQPKDVKDIHPSKGIKVSKVVGSTPQRRFKN